MSGPTKPNIATSLFAIHKVITRGLSVSMENIQRFREQGFPDEMTQTGFFNYVRALTSVLHGHHVTEDELAFPDFRELLPEAPFDQLSAQHQEMIPVLHTIQAAIESCAATDQTSRGLEELQAALLQINDLWHPHIRVEEKHFDIQKLGQMLTVDEHLGMIQRYGKHSQEHTGPPYLTVPFILFNLPVEIRDALAKGMPPEVTTQLVPVVWRDQWSSMKPFLLE